MHDYHIFPHIKWHEQILQIMGLNIHTFSSTTLHSVPLGKLPDLVVNIWHANMNYFKK